MNDSAFQQASLNAAREDFRQARQQAALQDLFARFTGQSADLLSFEDVRRKLRATDTTERGLQEVPVSAIVGTTGRYTDFTRTFLPRGGVDEGRWARVKAATETEAAGLPPVELYKIGAAYFVKDGHHRVSIARQLGAETVQGYVTEVSSKVPLSPTDQPDDVIRKAEYAEFLEATRLDTLRAGVDLTLSVPGQYARVRELIELHGFLQEAAQHRNLTDAEVLASWYDNEYLPVVRVIRERGLLRDFPGRTEADLYVWLAQHSAEIREALGWNIQPAAMLAELAENFNPGRGRWGRLLKLVIPASISERPETGAWRKDKLEDRYTDRLFTRVLVPVSGEPVGWMGLEQALEVAHREWGELMGLHIVPTEAAKAGEAAEAVRADFNRRCAEMQMRGTLALEVGEVAAKISERAALADLVVLNLAHPPGAGPLQRLGSGFRSLLHRCPRPVLAVPGAASKMEKLLLAYDGSPKAREALFVATYMAEEWRSALTVISVVDGSGAPGALDHARRYLEFHELEAECVESEGPVATAILRLAAERGSDLILMGGYGAHPVVEVVVGSSVDRVLREAQCPVLICR